MLIGINSDCCGYNKSIEILPLVYSAGFTHVMINEDAGDLETQIMQAQKIGLAVSCVHLYGKTKKKIKESIKLCKKYGIGNFILHPTTLKISGVAFENIDAETNKNLRGSKLFCYDCGHHYLNTPSEDFLKQFANTFAIAHIHDNDLKTDLHWLPFDGKLDFHKIMNGIKAIYKNQILVLEVYKIDLANIPHPPYKNMTDSDYIKTAFERAIKLQQMVL